MKPDEFKKMDQFWMKKMKGLRDRGISPQILKGFSASVERRIAPGGSPERSPSRRSLPAWAPALAVLVIALAFALHLPTGLPTSAPGGSEVQLAQVSSSQLSEEIAALRELGVWTDEDEKEIGASSENAVEDLELSEFPGSGGPQLA